MQELPVGVKCEGLVEFGSSKKQQQEEAGSEE